MSLDSSASEILFEVATPLGFKVRLTRAHWDVIVTIKHPVMGGCEANVQDALINPDQVRVSRSDSNVFLFYGMKRERRWVCAVAKRLNGEGFLITAYPTDIVKEGVQVWPV
jgi:hypothetical protein